MHDAEPFDPRAFHARFETAMIVACARNGVIGRGGDLPWHLPDDLLHFMRSTKGCPVVMGRSTYETLDRPLPDRLNIVLSRSMEDPGDPSVVVARDLDAAIARGREAIETGRLQAPVWIAGGGQVYAQAMDRVQLVVRTLVGCEVEGDAFFPPLDPSRWTRVRVQAHEPDVRHAHAFAIEWWVSAGSAS